MKAVLFLTVLAVVSQSGLVKGSPVGREAYEAERREFNELLEDLLRAVDVENAGERAEDQQRDRGLLGWLVGDIEEEEEEEPTTTAEPTTTTPEPTTTAAVVAEIINSAGTVNQVGVSPICQSVLMSPPPSEVNDYSSKRDVIYNLIYHICLPRAVAANADTLNFLQSILTPQDVVQELDEAASDDDEDEEAGGDGGEQADEEEEEDVIEAAPTPAPEAPIETNAPEETEVTTTASIEEETAASDDQDPTTAPAEQEITAAASDQDAVAPAAEDEADTDAVANQGSSAQKRLALMVELLDALEEAKRETNMD